MYILGISCFYHDSAAVLMKDGEIVAAAQEERFTRKKHDSEFPHNAVAYCLSHAGISIGDVGAISFYDKPLLKFERIVETYLTFAPRGFKSFLMALPLWLKEKLWMSEYIKDQLVGFTGEFYFPEHHESHAASAFFPSPFSEAAFLTVDGVGEWSTTTYGVGSGSKVDIHNEIRFPHSLGLLYSAFTYYLGFKVNSGEYKVMGLAPYGKPKHTQLILDNLIDLKDDGSFKLDMNYFNYCTGLTMTSEPFHRLFGLEPRRPESPMTQEHMDIAASIQAVTEEVMMRIARHVREVTGQKNLCLAGGVSLNCVANGKILRSGLFDDIWIQPASGDAGGALGSALFVHYQCLGSGRKPLEGGRDMQSGSYLGPEFSDEEIAEFLDSRGAVYTKYQREEIPSVAAGLIEEGGVIGWFQGRMEFGPRALGSRSIVGDARRPDMQSRMNLKIKFRESFRPFAPSVLRERASEYFEIDRPSPYMLLVADVREDKRRPLTPEQETLVGIEKLKAPRSVIPAVTHVDYSARLQTVDAETNPPYHRLIEEFYKRTGCPVIINTSFNVRGEPIVCTPEDAYTCFMRTEMDYLVIGGFVLDKKKQPALVDDIDWRERFEPD